MTLRINVIYPHWEGNFYPLWAVIINLYFQMVKATGFRCAVNHKCGF